MDSFTSNRPPLPRLIFIYHYPCLLPDSAAGMVFIIFKGGIIRIGFRQTYSWFEYRDINIPSLSIIHSILLPISARHGVLAHSTLATKQFSVVIDGSRANSHLAQDNATALI